MREERIDWPNGAKMALSIVVNVEEGSEMTVARGDRGMEPVDELGVYVKSPIRNYSNESNYLYGIKAGAPRVVKLLKEYDIYGQLDGRGAFPRKPSRNCAGHRRSGS